MSYLEFLLKVIKEREEAFDIEESAELTLYVLNYLEHNESYVYR